MAIIKTEDKEVELEDDSTIIDACEELGVTFGCFEGVCGVCRISIIEGADNLNDLTLNEKNLDCNKDDRLACQCILKKGTVKIKI